MDLNDIEALKRRIAELEAAQGESKPNDANRINTRGGAAVEGSVEVANGHFIGRDFVQTVTNVIHNGEDPEEAKSVIALYLHALAKDLAGLKLGEIDASTDQSRKTPLKLADIYVPLNTTLRVGEQTSLADWLSLPIHGTLTIGGEDVTRRRDVSALEALTHHRELTLLGSAGSGKSTFGASVLLALTHVWQGHDVQLTGLGEHWTYGPLLPIRVILRRFAESLSNSDKPARAGDLWAYIGRDLEESGYGLSSQSMAYVQRIARQSGALFFLDGLDECGDNARRERVHHAVQELMCSAGPKCRFLLTARPYAWPGGPNPQQGVYALAALNDDQIEQFIHAWYDAVLLRGWLSPGDADRKREDLLSARDRRDLRSLASNPLLLTLMAKLHTNRGRLPDDRADLYQESVDLLLLRWNRQIGADKALLDELAVPGLKLLDLREVLEELAFNIHAQNVGREGTADVGEDKLARAFCRLFDGSKDKAAIVVEYIENRAGLLIGQGEKDGERQFTFPHRTFQEFLAASHLAALNDFPAECARLARAAPAHWQVVLPLAVRLAKVERGASAADELIGGVGVEEARSARSLTAVDWNLALLAGLQLLELGRGAIGQRERTAAIGKRVAGWLAASLPVHPDDGGMQAALRAQAGDVLSALGDPRFDPRRFYLPNETDLGFVRIPADPDFRIGTASADVPRMKELLGIDVPEYEINDEPTPTDEFYIARYPVTVAQFRAFVDATGYELGDTDALRDPDSRPVRWVSWHEALAYCRWLSGVLQTLPSVEVARLVGTGAWHVSLPSELEWEMAARGGLPNSFYPWGDEPDRNRANFDESLIADTSAVGCFAPNGYGLYDISGNVYAWTRSLWGKDWETPDFQYPYHLEDATREDLAADNNVHRVVRGGSWSFSRDDVRCASRYRNLPVNRYLSFGFRVVLRRSPVLCP